MKWPLTSTYIRNLKNNVNIKIMPVCKYLISKLTFLSAFSYSEQRMDNSTKYVVLHQHINRTILLYSLLIYCRHVWIMMGQYS